MSVTGVRVEAFDWDWQPGNGTRYQLTVTQVGEHTLFAWVNHGSMFVYPGELPHPRYVCEKMRINEADAEGVIAWLRSLGWR